MPFAEVAWIGQGLETGLRFEVAEKAAQKVGALLPGLVRDRLVERGVQAVEESEQYLEHFHGVGLAGLVAGEDGRRRQIGLGLIARGLQRRGPAQPGSALNAATGGCRGIGSGHGFPFE